MNIRLMRGQVVVREVEAAPSGALWTPTPGARQVRTHTGRVLALGPPARLTEHPDSPEVPHGFVVGDLVQYHFGAMGTQEARTRLWTDGEPATWMTQAEIDGVWEEGPRVVVGVDLAGHPEGTGVVVMEVDASGHRRIIEAS